MQDSFILALFVGFLATYSSRLLPFLLFKSKVEGKNLLILQKNMPLAIMIILVFYTFYTYEISNLKELFILLVSCAFVLFLHIKFKSALLSIVLGILLYMLLLRVF
ncbi:MAG TPA: AzlD domain-containing protein [Campylobacter avium]|uniref:AzlD domain-containing protein n=1 Tax=Campylobacter avium TaxID=522485 RepID=UPI001DFABB69|nr:AzlD domain-containing protein [Campylobacter avium]HJE66623.1 AzlD domain-containing protein [Campylobacter avium]